jgi:hypothetical protein
MTFPLVAPQRDNTTADSVPTVLPSQRMINGEGSLRKLSPGVERCAVQAGALSHGKGYCTVKAFVRVACELSPT